MGIPECISFIFVITLTSFDLIWYLEKCMKFSNDNRMLMVMIWCQAVREIFVIFIFRNTTAIYISDLFCKMRLMLQYI